MITKCTVLMQVNSRNVWMQAVQDAPKGAWVQWGISVSYEA